MHFIQLHKKTFFILFFLIVFQSNSFGQDFRWVYNTLNTSSGNQLGGYNYILDVIIDDQDNIYVTGRSQGLQDFSNGAGTLVFDTGTEYLHYIVKLDKNKNIIWFRSFNLNPSIELFGGMQLHLDPNQNLLVIIGFDTNGSSFIDLDPHPGEQQTIVNPNASSYGAIVKLNSDGNYLNSKYFEDLNIRDLHFDSNQNIIANVNKTIEIFDEPTVYEAKVFKLDGNLNEIWVNELDAGSSTILKLNIDSNDDIILTGNYSDYINFGGENYQNDSSYFTCKINSNGGDEWLLEQENVLLAQNGQVIHDNVIHFPKTYNESSTFEFENTTISNLPYDSGNENDAVLFTTDLEGNYISHFTFSGLTNQNILSFAINEFDEFIIGLTTGGQLFIRDSNNEEIASIKSEGETILLKMSASLELINFIELDHSIRDLQLDSENNIIINSSFRRNTDFDPHAINEYIIESDFEPRIFVLKLSYCEEFPPTGDDLIFCSDDNPTVADLEANEYNISWYSSMTSTVVLDDTIALQDGQTYYAKKNKEDHCPEIFGRLAVLVTVNPTPPAPILDAIQPCFSSSLTLADLNIDATNVDFFATLTTTVELSGSTTVEPGVTYYMSETVAHCESERVPFNIAEQSNVTVNNHTLNLCDEDRNNFEQINLSNYISYLLDGNPNDFTISYHNSLVDAENGSNPIQNFEEYQSTNQNIYVRFLYNDYACYQIATLTINVSAPPEITEIITQDGIASSNSITVLPSNPQYLYSIDGIHYQSSNVFDNVLAGEYLVYVKDSLEACAEVTEKVYLLTYPKFFTPNGDGYNDFWKIKYAQFQFAVDVEIYDRYGKLLTSFDKNSPGWDGKYNGENLPSTDYWFKVMRFIDKKVIHKGHFSLKR